MQWLVVLCALVFASIVADGSVSMNNPNFCYMTDPIRSMTNMFGIITSYEAIRRFNFTTVGLYTSNCTPSRFWYLGRYGTRHPYREPLSDMLSIAESNIQQEIVNNYNSGRTTLCSEDFEAISTWRKPANVTLEVAGLLVESGALAMQNIAKRYQQRFPNLLSETYSPERFLFRYTSTEHTNASIRAFATGLFGEGAENVFYENIPDFDFFLTPFDNCPLFDQEIGWYSPEMEAFHQGPEFEEMIDQVNRKLGFTTSNRLNLKQVLSLWDWCRYETVYSFEMSNSETGDNSTWCAAFSLAHHLLIEYSADLFTFHTSGYGVRNQRLIQNIPCGLAQNLLNYLQSEDDTDQLARIFIAYPEEIQALLMVLGLFRDVWPLHRHNYAQQLERNWRASVMTPFSKNLAVVRYDCEDGDHDIIFYLNEEPILVPGCSAQDGVCKLSNIVRLLERFAGVDCSSFFCSIN